MAAYDSTRFRFDEDEFHEEASRRTRPTAARITTRGGDIEMADRAGEKHALPAPLGCYRRASLRRVERRVSFNPGEEAFEEDGLDEEAQESVVR